MPICVRNNVTKQAKRKKHSRFFAYKSNQIQDRNIFPQNINGFLLALYVFTMNDIHIHKIIDNK